MKKQPKTLATNVPNGKPLPTVFNAKDIKYRITLPTNPPKPTMRISLSMINLYKNLPSVHSPIRHAKRFAVRCVFQVFAIDSLRIFFDKGP